MMNTQTQFTPGQMVEFRATRDFGMGGMNIQRGMTISYDGYNVSVGGRQQALPGFRGALKAGWAVPIQDYDPSSVQSPRSAGIKVRPADTGNPMNRQPTSMATIVDAEETIVSDVREHAQNVRSNNQGSRRTAASATGIEPQDGVVVRTLSPVSSKDGPRTTLTGTNHQQLINGVSGSPIEPGRGRTRDEGLAAMTPEQRERYLSEIEARKAVHVPLDGELAQGRVVASLGAPKEVESMGVRLTTTVGGGVDTVDLTGLDSPAAAPEVVEVEGMKFTNTAPPKRPPPSPIRTSTEALDPRRVIARAICKDFPDLYDFEAPTRKRVARIRADFEDRPDVIRAVAAAETDADMKAQLISEFPEAFTS